MSSASPFRRSHWGDGSPGVRRLAALLVGSARTAGFWSAVVLPFVLLGLVLAGLAAEHATLFGTLVGVNLLALRLGQGYKRA